MSEALNPKQRRLLELMLAEKKRRRQGAKPGRGEDGGRTPSIPRRPPSSKPLLSYAQQRLWFIDQFQPGSAAYNIPSGVRLAGPLDPDLFEHSLRMTARRHETMRTTYVLEGAQPVQVIAEEPRVAMPSIDLSALPRDRAEREGQRVIDLQARSPFAMAECPPCRALLVRLAEREHVFLVVMHHILSDTWTTGVFFREMVAHYRHLRDGSPLEVPELPIQYADYAVWQREMLAGGPLEAQVTYWREAFRGAPPLLDLPVDRPRPSLPSFRGGRVSLLLPSRLTDRLKRVAGANEATLFMTFMAVFQTLLHRMTQECDVLAGTPMANRNRTELENLIGLFVNTLVLRTDFSGDPTFKKLLGQVRETTLEGLSNHDVPFEKVVEELDLERDTRYNPLFQVIFAFQNVPIPELVAEGLTLERYEFRETTARLDLELDLQEMPYGFVGWLGFNADIFDGSTVARLATDFRVLLEGVAEDAERRISQLPLLAEAERHQVLVQWSGVRSPYPREATVAGLFTATAESRPREVAVVCGELELTYGELERLSSQLAHDLLARGVGFGQGVAIACRRSPEMVVGLLAILKAGGYYVALEAALPDERLAFLLKDAAARFVLTQEKLAARFAALGAEPICLDAEEAPYAGRPAQAPEVRVTAEDLAYVSYTSGSTGRPKGVAVPQRAVVRLVRGNPYVDFSPRHVFLQMAPLAFDASTFEIWGSLLNGARLAVYPGEQVSLPELGDALRHHGVTTLWLTAGLFHLMVDERPQEIAGVEQLLAGGDVLSLPHVRRRLAAQGRGVLVNGYGPTEATTFTCCHPIRAGEPLPATVPIGRPIANTRVFVADRHLGPVPQGARGELLIGGDALARGYLGRSAFTAERFVPDPLSGEPGARLYKSGDLVRFLADGRLEFLGRFDHQVKIRGFRVEPGEIEAVLAESGAVSDAVVLARQDAPGGKSLVAYVVGAEGTAPDTAALRAFLAERLSEHMVPSAFVVLDELPLTPNGKVDRRALPRPSAARGQGEATAAPRPLGSELESRIAEAWKKALQVEEVGRDENFFESGGNSLLMAQVHNDLAGSLAPDLTLVDLFKYPTIGALADFLSQDGSGGVEATLREAVARRRKAAGTEDAEIAVVGMAMRFPDANTPDEYWQNLVDGVHSVRHFSRQEALAVGVSPQLLDDPSYVLAEGSIDEVETFDYEFFGYKEAGEVAAIDPQQRIFLENAWEALERAGYEPRTYEGTIGLFGGVNMSSYLFSNLYEHDPLNVMSHFLTRIELLSGNQGDFMCTRISYLLDLRGPSMTVQSACSTSLVAVHLASESLRRHECDMCLAGGVQIRVPQRMGYMYQEGGFPSPDGYCRSFDAKANGNVHGNGSGILLLKRLGDALADGDHVYAVIRGSAVTNDGAVKVGYSAPGVEGQARAAAEALAVAGVDPATVGYLEASGTATELGDPLEIEALTQAYRAGGRPPGSCPIGSVKSNIGHLDVASGAAALIKTALVLERGKIPKSLHFETPNPVIDFASSPFFVNTELREWPRGAAPRRAAVHAYAVGGTNAHLVLEEAPEAAPASASRPWQLLAVSARTSAALHRATVNLRDHLERHDEVPLADVAYTLQVGRRPFAHRRFVLCRDHGEALEHLRDLPPDRVRSAFRQREGARGVALLLPGKALPEAGAAAHLYTSEATFRRQVEHCAELLNEHLELDLRDVFDRRRTPAALDGRWHEAPFATAVLFAFEYALARLWMEWGAVPGALFGEGAGELVAACLSGALNLEDALALAVAEGRLAASLEQGARLEVCLAESEARRRLGAQIALDAVLGEELCHLVGPEPAVEELQDRLDEEGVDCCHLGPARLRPKSGAAELEALREVAGAVSSREPRIPWVSALTGEWAGAAEVARPSYWAERWVGPVRIAEGLRKLLAEGDRALLEVGAGERLSTVARRRGAGRPIFASLAAGGGLDEVDASATAQLVGTLGRLWLAGVAVDWRGFYRHETRRRVPLPTYPFERIRIWAEPKTDWRQAFQAPPDLDVKTELDRWFHAPSWQRSEQPVPPPETDAGDRSWLVFADADPGTALAERLRRAGHGVVTVRPGRRFARRGSSDFEIDAGVAGDYQTLLGALHDEGKVPAVVVHAWCLDRAADGEASPIAGREPERGFWSFVHLARALSERGAAATRCIAVTQGVREVTGEEELVPGRATLLAPLLVLPKELPDLTCRHVDVVLPPAGSPREARLLDDLADELRREEAEPWVAYRGRHRWVQTFEPLELVDPAPGGPGDRPARLREEGVYLIIGGGNRFALLIADFLARAVRAKLVLVGESGLPEPDAWDEWQARHGADDELGRKIARLRQLEDLGSELLLLTVDPASAPQMKAALQRVYERFGVVHGVFHAAAEPAPEFARSVAEVDPDFYQYRLRARLGGVLNLAELLRDQPLDFHLLASTLGSILGAPLAVVDSAADLFLDAFARRQNQLDSASWTSVDWDFVAVDGEDPSAPESKAAPAPWPAITAAEGAEVLRRVLAAGELAQVAVSTADLTARIEHDRARAVEVRRAAVEVEPRPDLEVPYAAPRNALEEEMAQIWAEALGLEEVGVRDNFFDLGGNSLIATQLVSRIRERFQVDLALGDFFEEATLARTAEHVEIGRWTLETKIPEAHAALAAVAADEEEVGEI